MTMLLAVAAISVTTMQSCKKTEMLSEQDIGAIAIQKYDSTVSVYMAGPENFADIYVIEHAEQSVMSEAEFTDLCEQITVFSDYVLREALQPGRIPITTPEAIEEKYKLLKAEIAGRDDDSGPIERIIQLTPTKRILDADENSLALTIANFGATVTSGGMSNISYDYHRSPQNRITNLDIALANWALNTTNQTGGSFIADDDFIDVIDPMNFVQDVSGGNYFTEVALVYNGPDIDFSYFDVQTQNVETIPIASGELLVYDNTESQFGTLFFNLTLINEPGGPTYIDATLSGPIPGLQSGQSIAFSGGDWPVVNEPA